MAGVPKSSFKDLELTELSIPFTTVIEKISSENIKIYPSKIRAFTMNYVCDVFGINSYQMPSQYLSDLEVKIFSFTIYHRS